jgi:hypothetical protein
VIANQSSRGLSESFESSRGIQNRLEVQECKLKFPFNYITAKVCLPSMSS